MAYSERGQETARTDSACQAARAYEARPLQEASYKCGL